MELLSGEDLCDPRVYLVFLNGIILGVHRHPQRFVKAVRALRRKGAAGEPLVMLLFPRVSINRWFRDRTCSDNADVCV
jgi:hypothetical protein